MADENLSLSITFEEVEALIKQVQKADESFRQLGDTTQGVAASFDTAASSARSMSDALDQSTSKNTAFTEIKTETEQAADAMEALGVASKEVETETKQAKDSLDALSGNLGKAGDEARETSKDLGGITGALSRIPLEVKAVVGAFLGFQALQTIGNIVTQIRNTVVDSVRSFADAEASVVQFGIAIGSTGNYSRAAVSEMQDFATSVQQMTRFTDDAVTAAAALIAQVGQISGDQLKRATQAAVELSAVFGRDLQSTALLVAKAAQGSLDGFRRLGIVLDDTIPPAERLNAVLALVEQRFGGTAQLQAETYAGSVDKLKNSWNDLKESVGAAIVSFLNLPTQIAAVTAQLRAMGIGLPQVSADAIDFTTRIDGAREALEEFNKAGTQGLTFGKVKFQDVEKGDLLKSLGDIQVSIPFTIQQGSIQDAKKRVEELDQLLEDVARTADVQLITRIAQLRDAAREALRLRVVAETTAARADVTSLISSIESANPALTVRVIDENIQAKMMDLESRRPEIEAVVDLNTKQLEELSRFESAVDLGAPKMDAEAFRKLADEAAALFNKRYAEGIEGNAAALESALRLAPILKRLEEIAKIPEQIVSVPVEIDIVGPPLETQVSEIASRAEQELSIIADVVGELQRLGQAPVGRIIETQEMADDVANLSVVRQQLATELALVEQAIKTALSVGDFETAGALTLAVFQALRQGTEQARVSIGQFSAESQAAFSAATTSAKGLVQELNKLPPAFAFVTDLGQITMIAQRFDEGKAAIADMSTEASIASAGITSAFNTVADALTGRFATMKEAIIGIIKSMVDAIMKMLARIAAFEFLSFLFPGAGWLARLKKTSFVQPEFPAPTQKTSSTTAQFSSLARERALAQQPIVVRVEQPREKIAPPPPAVTIQALDGVSIRRAYTSGALRDEALRSMRRAGR